MPGKNPQDYEYSVIRLPAFPQHPIAVARERATNLLWIPVKATCAGMRLDYASQLAKLQAPRGEWRKYLDLVPMPTKKGYRDATSIEWQGFGMWIAGLQEERVNADLREYLALYKRQLFAAASAILMHRPGEVLARLGVQALPATAGQLPPAPRVSPQAAWLHEHEDRLTRLEDLMAGDEAARPRGTVEGSLAAAIQPCPCCGALLRVLTGQLRLEAADEPENPV